MGLVRPNFRMPVAFFARWREALSEAMFTVRPHVLPKNMGHLALEFHEIVEGDAHAVIFHRNGGPLEHALLGDSVNLEAGCGRGGSLCVLLGLS